MTGRGGPIEIGVLTRLEILEELARLRRENRDGVVAPPRRLPLHEFVREAWELVEPAVPFVDNWHLHLVCERLERCLATPDDKLLINIPPGCMKSLLVSVFWPCWAWGPGGWPESRWFFASYMQDLATRDSMKCRVIVTSPWYQRQWPVRLTGDANLKTWFQNTKGGYRLATSVGGRGTGDHPDVIVCDDPHNVRQTESAAQRQEALSWWDGTITSRGRSRKARRVLCMQRLHTHDLSGHLIEQGGYEHLCLPMRFEPGRCAVDPRTEAGALLWPALFDEASVQELERGMGSLRAAGQLQQRPTAVEGDIFRLEFLSRRTSRWPVDGRAVRYWDTAGTQGGGDWTVGVLMAEADGLYYVCDVAREQVGYRERERLIAETALRDQSRFRNPPETCIERPTGLGGESTDRMLQQLAGLRAWPDRVTGRRSYVQGEEIPGRWMNLAAQVESGNVILLDGEWTGAFVDELLAAPNGAHDDQVVAAAGAFSMLTVNRKVDLERWLRTL